MRFIGVLCLTLVAGLFLAPQTASAADIGSGYTCNGTDISLRGSNQSYAAAKQRITERRNKKRAQLAVLKRAKKRNAARIATTEDAIADLRGVLKRLKQCASGELSPEDIDQFFTSLAGKYTGGYSGDQGGLHVEGPLSMQFGKSGSDIDVEIVFGGPLAMVVPGGFTQFSFSIKGKSLPLGSVKVEGTSLGDMTVSISADHRVRIKATDVPNPLFDKGTLTFDGQVSSDFQQIAGTCDAGSAAEGYEGVSLLHGGFTVMRQ